MCIKPSFRKLFKEFLNSLIPLREYVFETETHNPIILLNFHFSSSQVPKWLQMVTGSGEQKEISMKGFGRR